MMRKTFFALALAALAAVSAVAAKRAVTVNSIDPPHWWVGMENDTLQLLIGGENVGLADLTLDAPGVTLVSTVDNTSKNYKIAYVTVDKALAQPGKVKMELKLDGRSKKLNYELKQRTWKGSDCKGFDASDVLYLIMPDRFADGDTTNNSVAMKQWYKTDRSVGLLRHGGDIKGMRNHIDYIKDLGVTAIWVNPVLENDMMGGSYHGYATTNYYKIDPRFGSNQEWTDFVAASHQNGIKVVMDMIFNHCGSDHPWMACLPMADWLNHPEGEHFTNFRLSTLHDPYASDYDRDATVNGWFAKQMPDLNQNNPHLMRYLIQNSIWWIEESKIDGIRMDTYPYADMKAMAGWIAAVEKEYPHFNIVGECWYPTEASEAFWQRGSKVNPVDPNLPTVMDFKVAIDGRKMFTEPTKGLDGLNRVYDHLSLDYIFPNPQKILTFFDNHDTARLLDTVPSDLGWWKQAQVYLLTSRGIPQIYYGTEVLMHGNILPGMGGDSNVRQDMPGGFPGDGKSVFEPSGRTAQQQEAWAFLSKVLNWRKGNDVIARGTLKHFMPLNGVYTYQRALGDSTVTVIMNGTDEQLTAKMDNIAEILPAGSVRHDILTDRDVTIAEEMTFAPRETLILVNK